MSLRHSAEQESAVRSTSSRPWSRRRNRLGVRRGEMVIITLLALLVGVLFTFLTAYMGVR